MLKMIAWNIARRSEAWRLLVDSDAEIGLLQEANSPPADVIAKVTVDPAPWKIGTQLWRTAIVKLSDHVQVNWLAPSTPASPRNEGLEQAFLTRFASANS